ncbi:dipeptidase [Dehalobacterium formicoaceticum]|uniref:Dipeptidase n=1 Tax=Dehalobacterium formicoaceticum TaxID=51515 RepID=A0ABT1Y2S1_9FIRM|nr:C69 family dipeptidase [Dehalobacterium formicoaceticum]MCR6544254.1 C69 family dipeptidase [Dehalobacterium formicoaceticum]
MCFSLIVGKDATQDGSVILGANNDWPGYPGHILYTPRKQHGKDAKSLLASGKEIPELDETFAYTHTTTAYTTGTRDESWMYGVNENQVAVSIMGVYAFKQIPSANGIEADDLTILVLERGKTARQSVEMLGELIKEHGFSVSSIEGAAGSVVMGIADPKEGFWLEVIPGGHWVAKRVPDDMISVRPNCFGVQEVDFQDPDNFLWSEGVAEFAEAQGWHRPNEGTNFNFSSCYSDDVAICAYGKADDPVNAYRRWRAMNIATGIDYPLDELVYEAVPKEKISVKDAMNILRDTLEGTKYDLTKAPEAGVHKNPFWMEVSSSIGQGGTVLSMIAHLRDNMPNEIGGQMWFSLANGHLSTFLPCYIGSKGMPTEFKIGEILEFDENSAWWVFQELGELCYRNYQEIAKKEVIPVFRAMEDETLALLSVMEKCFLELYQENPELALETMKFFTTGKALIALDVAKKLSRKIKGKYLANVIM